MRRRAFIRLMAAAATLPISARAQQPAKPSKVGILTITQAEAGGLTTALRNALRDAGYVEGQNLAFESRSAGGNPALLPDLAADLVRAKVDVIAAVFTPSVLAAKRATGDIPIVGAVMADPVGTGLVESLSRPGGNVTGVSNMAPETAGKCVELFRDMLPSLKRVGALANPLDPFTKPFLEQIQLGGRTTGVEIAPVAYARSADEYAAAFATLAEGKPDAIIVQGINAPAVIADFAIKYRLPSASVVPAFVRAGGLMSYGADVPELFQRSATFIQKILQGSKPANMPVEQPTKFNLAINLRTAKAVGVAIPPSFLLRADEVIE
jgi:putative ABC transport system substrate-binding protein